MLSYLVSLTLHNEKTTYLNPFPEWLFHTVLNFICFTAYVIYTTYRIIYIYNCETLTLPWWRCPHKVTFRISSGVSIRSAKNLKQLRTCIVNITLRCCIIWNLETQKTSQKYCFQYMNGDLLHVVCSCWEILLSHGKFLLFDRCNDWFCWNLKYVNVLQTKDALRKLLDLDQWCVIFIA